LSSCLSKNVKIKIHKTIILPVVLYGCETWSLTLRDEYILKVFQNRVLQRDEMVGFLRKLHEEELHDLYSLPSIIRMIESRREGYEACMGEKRNMYKGFWWDSHNE
jgi:hypothetical protein